MASVKNNHSTCTATTRMEKNASSPRSDSVCFQAFYYFAEHMRRNLYSVTYRDVSEVSTRGVCEKQPFNLHCHHTDGQKRVVSVQRSITLHADIGILGAHAMNRDSKGFGGCVMHFFFHHEEAMPAIRRRKQFASLYIPPFGFGFRDEIFIHPPCQSFNNCFSVFEIPLQVCRVLR